MGYDIVRLNEKGEPKQITDLADSDYFRLNIWGMSRARKIAVWGAGKISNEEMMKEYSDGEPSSGGLQQMLAAAAAIMTSAGTEDLPWVTPFVTTVKSMTERPLRNSEKVSRLGSTSC